MKPDKPTFDPKAAKLLAAHETPGTLFAVCLDEPRRTLYGAGFDGASLHGRSLRGQAHGRRSAGRSTTITSPRWY